MMSDDETTAMDQFSAHLDRGWDLVSRGDFPAALVSAEKSLELQADAPEAHYLLGYVRQCEGHAEEAIDHYRQALELDEGFFEAMLYAADLLIHDLGDPTEALSFLDDAEEYAETDDEIADVLLLRREALHALGRGDEADRLATALPTGPFENPGIAYAVAEVLLDRGRTDEAEERLREALRLDGQFADAHHLLGIILDNRGAHREATVSFLQARDLDLVSTPPRWSMEPARFEQRVQASIARLPSATQAALDGALVHVGDLPGAEVVADGVDPRVEVLAELVTVDDEPDDALPGPEEAGPENAESEQVVDGAPAPGVELAAGRVRVGRLFVYQRNVERNAVGQSEVEAVLGQALEQEIARVTDHIRAHEADVAARGDAAGTGRDRHRGAARTEPSGPEGGSSRPATPTPAEPPPPSDVTHRR